MAKEYVQAIADRNTNFSQWYLDVVLKAELADYAPVRGSMVVRPYGYRIWELLQRELDDRFKATGVMNAYFPLFIPKRIFQKEIDHIEGFAPEVPWVTKVGDEELAEPYLVRPTSETIIGTMYSKWIQSYRDLPLLINQWCNVVRWEKRTLPFLRTTEFLWQEGHTAHRNEQEARARTRQMLDLYHAFLESFLAIPVVPGRKSEREKFAGAVETLTVEALLGDGRALQSATSHYLGDGFAKALDIMFLDEDGQHKPVHTTSWGLSWRVIGALIMVHGDDRGLVLPPAVAPYQVVFIPIGPEKDRAPVLEAVRSLAETLSGVRVHIDDRTGYSAGWKFNEWELRGVPLRIEVGPRDLQQQQAIVVRRDTGEKRAVPMAALGGETARLLEQIQRDMLRSAQERTQAMTYEIADWKQFETQIEAPKPGFLYADWCGDTDCEAAIKERTGATIRCIPFEGAEARGACVHCGKPGVHRALFAKAY